MRASHRCASAHIAQRGWKTRLGILSQMISLTQHFAVERCQASALLNAQVLLSFSLDGQMNMLQVSSYRLQVKIHELPTKKESKTN